MIHKTEGIILRTLKHQDSNLITTVFTRDFGRMSFILKGFRTARGRQKFSYFQPLSIVDLVYQERPNRDLHSIREGRLVHLLHTVQTEPVKLSLGLAMMEIFYDTVKEAGPDEELYQFLKRLILTLDLADKRLIHFFIYFLVHLTKYLGFFPSDQTEGQKACSFDPKSGILSASAKSDRIALLLRQFIYAKGSLLPDEDSVQQILFNSEEKRELIKELFVYYQWHIDGFQYPQTMKVFAEVFA
ncbi:MAG: DNA repair protein RecO [Bacteroidia bacterium]|nr:DNA repair protein RecO [Bacteroidia bacterium]